MKFSTILKIIYINLKIKFKSKLTPYKVLLQLTNDCNSKCQYCQIWRINQQDPNKKAAEITPNELLPFFQVYGKDIYWLSLSGGEISLYQNFEQLLNMISKNCPSLCIITFTTNGLEPKIILSIAQLIKTVLPDADFFITISLDGDEKLHNKLRGIENNYKNAQETYSLLRDNNFSVHWGATLNNSNAEYFSKNSASQIKAVSLVHDQGIYNTKFKIENEIISRALKNIIKNYRIANISEIIEFIFLKLGLKYLHNNRQKLPIPCSVLSTSLHISPYGDVSPCMYMPSIGNIKTSKIDTVLDSTLAKHMLEDIKNANCPKCWMNCYAPHSMMSAPLKTMKAALWK